MTSGAGYGHQPTAPMSYPGARAQLRASDADRDQVVELLKRAFTEGRLTQDEYDGRLHRALSATTYADLDACLADLIPPQAAMPYRAQPKTNTLAILSLVCGIGQMMLWPLSTIPAIVLGHVARRQIRRSRENGAGLALAGLILGWIGAAVLILGIVAVILLFAVYSSRAVGGGGGGAGSSIRVR